MGLMDTIKEKNDELQKKLKQLNEQLALETKLIILEINILYYLLF